MQISAVHARPEYGFSKITRDQVRLIEGLGVEGDVHAGVTVKHRSRMRRDPAVPNLRQVHLIHAELIAELQAKGFDVKPGDMGENITTKGIDILALPRGTRLHLGESAVIEITGLRNPCSQLNDFRPGLTEAVLERRADGTLIRKAGIMSIVIAGGIVRPGDEIRMALPAEPHEPLVPV